MKCLWLSLCFFLGSYGSIISYVAQEGLVITPPAATQKVVQFYVSNASNPFGIAYHHCSDSENDMDSMMINSSQKLYQTIVTKISKGSTISPWFTQLVWSKLQLENVVEQNSLNVVVSLTETSEDHLTYQMILNSDTDPIGVIDVFDQTIQIFSNNQFMCQAIGRLLNSPSSMVLDLSLYQYDIKCDFEILDNFTNTIFKTQNLLTTDIDPLLPLFGTLILTQTPLGQWSDQCISSIHWNWEMTFIITTASLGGIILVLLIAVITLSCHRKGSSKNYGVELVRSGSRYTLTV